ncbi:FG-GAP-like repeat-containing protein [Streptomyces sp. NPDC021622]|uniref:FG-GAP-like repeat-containing protein n=1 Tax=Streptomyces sp. NPDC021622 TaxID=3155013 RepID=UPI0033E4196E
MASTADHPRRPARNKILAAGALCAATALGVAGLTAGGASAAEPSKLRADYNGDGYVDLAVGVPGATVGGKAKAGYVNVVWGGASGLGKHGSTNVGQGTAGVPGTVEADDRFGTAVHSADLNGDGYSDLIASAPGEAIDTTPDVGTISVLWGSAGGFAKGGITAAKGGSEDSRIGGALSTGDYDGDGTQDLVFPIAGEEGTATMMRPGPITSATNTRPALVENHQFGGPRAYASADFDGDGKDDLAVTYKGMESSGTFVVRKASGEWRNFWSTGDYGTSVAAGDFDGDGTADLALGGVTPNPEADGTHCEDRLGGAVLTVYGKQGAALGGGSACTTQSTPEVGGSPESGDNFGASLAVANLDRDGIDELVVGGDAEAVGTAANAGTYWVLASAGTGQPLVGPAFSQNSAGVAGTAEAGDRLGAGVAAGDFNGDAYPDVAVGAPGEDGRSGGVWYSATPKEGPNPAVVSVTPGKLGLTGASEYGTVLAR